MSSSHNVNVSIAAFAIQLWSLTAAAQVSACQCDSVDILQNRICESRAAIAEYQQQLQRIRAKESKSGEPVWNTEKSYNDVQQTCIVPAINSATDSQPHYTADTHTGCNTTFNDPTHHVVDASAVPACQRELLTAHENTHVYACRNFSDKDAVGWLNAFMTHLPTPWGKDWGSDGVRSLTTRLQEEIWSYENEIRFARKRLADLAASCPKLQSPSGGGAGPAGRDYTQHRCPSNPPGPPPACRTPLP